MTLEEIKRIIEMDADGEWKYDQIGDEIFKKVIAVVESAINWKAVRNPQYSPLDREHEDDRLGEALKALEDDL